MPYYQCPKCGSKDSYSGTEIVSEHKHKSGHMIAGPENSLSMTPVMRVGGSNHTEHKQLTVQNADDVTPCWETRIFTTQNRRG